MSKEAGVIAVAGARRTFITLWAAVCLLFACAFFLFAGLRVLGLIGVAAMLGMRDTISSYDPSTTVVTHAGITLIYVAIGFLFLYFFRVAIRSLSVPFEEDIKKAATIVNDIEKNVVSGAKSWRESARVAIAESKSKDGE